MKKPSKDYYSKINLILKKISKEEDKKIIKCAKLIKASYKKGGQLFIFGTGHSKLLAEESFHRAGGYAAACPVRSDEINFSCSLVSMAPGRYCRMKEIGSSTMPSFLHIKAAIRPDLPRPALQCMRIFLPF